VGHTGIIKFCTRSPYLFYYKVHICMNPNFMVHTRIDWIYYVIEHDLSSAQAIINFFKTLLMNILLGITVNKKKKYYLNSLNCHKKLIIRNDCFNFQVYKRWNHADYIVCKICDKLENLNSHFGVNDDMLHWSAFTFLACASAQQITVLWKLNECCIFWWQETTKINPDEIMFSQKTTKFFPSEI
jgi:hypothetical protein